MTDWKAFLDNYHEGRVRAALDVLCESIIQGDVEEADQRLKTAIKISRQVCTLAFPILNEAIPMTTFKMGRNRPAPYRKLNFASYVGPSLPDPPAYVHRGAKALACLSNIYGNDTRGDCTAAGAGHGEGIWRGNAGNNDPAPTLAEVIQFYSETTGYVDGNPSTDNGGDEVKVLNFWRDTGFMIGDARSKIAAWCNVDATNPKQVRQAIWLAEFVYFGVELPKAWVSPMPQQSGFVWDVAGDPVPANGHCFISGSYDADLIIDTWGEFGKITDAAVAKYASGAGGELHCCFSLDSINRATQKSDSGFDFETLLVDSAAL